MSRYPCDNLSWSSRRPKGEFKMRDQVEANKENREPISPLSRLAERVDDSRRWAPIPDRWHNHCEWLVHHHRNLRKRFRKTTADDQLAGVLETLKCTGERRRGSDDEKSVDERRSRHKRIRSDEECTELEPTKSWPGYDNEELLSSPKVYPFSKRENDTKNETKNLEPKSKARYVKSKTSTKHSKEINESNDESDAESSAAGRSTSRSPSPVEGAFQSENFRTSTPTAEEKGRRDAEEPCESFRRSSAWKDYIMSHDPILFRSYVDTKYPKKSWRHCHQKVATRHGGKYRRSSSGKVRKPPTPKSLRISWNSLDDVVQNDGILRSPLQLPPVLPGDVTPPMKTVSDQEIDDRLNNNPSANNSHADDDLSDVIGDGIRAIREDCGARHGGVADESYVENDERDADVDPSELSDISYGEEELRDEELRDEEIRDEESRDEELRDEELEEGEIVDTDDCREDLDDVNNDGDIDDICRIVDKELHHHDYHPDDILNEISFDILDDLEVDSKYPPNYFRSGFADRTLRRRKAKRAPRFMNTLDPQARTFRPRYTREEDNEDLRIVKFADHESSDDGRDREKMEDASTPGTKFYPSDVRFKKDKKDAKKRVEEHQKASDHTNAESKGITPEPVPVPVKRSNPKLEKGKNIKECGSSKIQMKEGSNDGQEHFMKGDESRTVESDLSLRKPETKPIRDSGKIESTPSLKPIAKGKTRRQVGNKISVVMGRRPAQEVGNQTRCDDGRSVLRSLAAGEEGNGSASLRRTPQLRPIDTRRYVTSAASNKHMKVQIDENMAEVVESDVNLRDEFADENFTDEQKKRKDAAKSKNVDQLRTFQSDPRVRNIEVSQPKYHAMMNQRLAILKESYGNSPVGVARQATLPDRLKKQMDSKETTVVGSGSTSKEREQPSRVDRQHSGHRDVELPDVKNKRVAKNVPRAKINPLSKPPDGATNDGAAKRKGITDTSDSRQKEPSCSKTRPTKETQSESMFNVEGATSLNPEQDDFDRIRGTNVSEASRESSNPLQPLMQNPPHRFPHPHQHINPNVHPNMHPMPAPGNVPLFHHPSGQHPQFNPTFSAYHHHQMALRAAAMNYYNQQRHLALQRHHPPGLFPPHPHHVNMHPGCRPEWNMPRPGPPH